MITHTLRTLIVKTFAVAIALVVAAVAALLLNWSIHKIDGALHKSSHKAPASVQYVLPEAEWSPVHPTASRISF
jgi:cell division protein FtsN